MTAPPAYRVIAHLATGGMAEVLLARREGVSGPAVVLKRVRADFAADPEFAALFRNEARIARSLEHPNIAAVLDVGEGPSGAFLAMEYVEGWDLARVLGACARTGTLMPVRIALRVIGELAAALAHAHARRDASGAPLGIVHRDVSPPNVLLSRRGAVKLTDFGIARAAAEARTTATLRFAGKVPYMSPEQASGARVDARSDLFSLGVVLFEVLAARRLFPGDDDAAVLAAVRRAAVPPPSGIRSDVPPELDALVATALAADPARRFQRAEEMRAALDEVRRRLGPPVRPPEVARFLASLDLPAPPAADAASSGASPRRWGILAAGLVMAFAAGAGARVAGGRVARPAAERATRLEVRAGTPGASVSIDGVDLGPAPVVVEGLPRSVVEIQVRKAGYASFTRRADLGAAPHVVVEAGLDRLEPAPR